MQAWRIERCKTHGVRHRTSSIALAKDKERGALEPSRAEVLKHTLFQSIVTMHCILSMNEVGQKKKKPQRQ
jgi:hypothetical protein